MRTWKKGNNERLQATVRRRRRGLCPRCGRTMDKARTGYYCNDCVTIESQRLRKRRERLSAHGLCVNCGKEQASNGRVNCDKCRKASSQRHKKYREERQLNGTCSRCGKHPPLTAFLNATSRLCEVCYLRRKAAYHLGSSRYGPILKEKLIAQDFKCAYTGEVLILGVNDSIDHIHPIARFPHMVSDIDNVEWTTRIANFAKRDLLPDEFLSLVRAIAAHKLGLT